MPATGACSRRTSPDARFCRRRAKSHGSAAGLRNEGTFVGKLLAQRPVRVLGSHGKMIRLLRRCGLAVENLRPDPDATASHPLEIKNRDVTPSVVGGPARLYPPGEADQIRAGLEEAGGFLPFVFGTDPAADRGEQMRTAMRRYSRTLGRHHRGDQPA